MRIDSFFPHPHLDCQNGCQKHVWGRKTLKNHQSNNRRGPPTTDTKPSVRQIV